MPKPELDRIAHGLQMADIADAEAEIMAMLEERRRGQIEQRRDILLLAMTLGLPLMERTRKMALLQTWILNGDLLEDEWNEVKQIGRSA